MVRKFIVLFFILFSKSPLFADQTSDAKIVLSKYFESLNAYDTSLMSDLMHPEALFQFKDVFNKALDSPKSELAKSQILPLFRVNTTDEFKKLSNRDAYKAFNDLVVNAQPEIRRIMNQAQFAIVTTDIKNDLAYFTYRMSLNINGETINKNVVQKLKLHDGHWMLLLAEDAETSIAMISAKYK